ncbi:antitermination protein [Salmonella enterica]|nr:antitermination protein [Salmonella enterica]EBQ6116969.1 antitermination protein [Salmonella enterica subsp. enterica serovar Praha]EBX7643633.1 antitermination protein [Salmonella enterica subsp. enterica serovar Saintpaul]ECC9412636.1 antitermination protein [Salmonella enterica subsp. enterica]EHF1445920.1 antitermination protein [Salmonella enterica subsp. enterica serovar 4,5,12:b:-]EHG1526887.1 antitermination protein [Salmonella enterica subsp. enterica serovar 4,[5],12:b:-]
MKLEASLKHFSPQGMHISDSVKDTSPDRLTGTDVMAAIGTTSSRARFGLAAFFGKTGISKSDEQLAVQALARHAMETAPKNVRKAAGCEFGWCMQVLAQFAFAEYSRSAATTVACHTCKGSGRITRTQTTRKVSYPWGKAPYWASRSRAVRPSDWEKWTEVTEIVPAVCDACEGKGTISARCRCGGKGEVLDRKATSECGAPVFKACERCGGKGFSAVPSTAAYKAILKRVPDLHVRTWTRNWKPFLESLVEICYREESRADSAFQNATRFNDDGEKI